MYECEGTRTSQPALSPTRSTVGLIFTYDDGRRGGVDLEDGLEGVALLEPPLEGVPVAPDLHHVRQRRPSRPQLHLTQRRGRRRGGPRGSDGG